jgi:lipoate---protein ligase
MRLPRHDTPLRLSAEPPRQAIAADEALLDRVSAHDSGSERWWIADRPAVIVGLGLRPRVSTIVDLERCRAAGVEVLERRAGGGALLLDGHVLCGAICLPIASVPRDVTESYRWLGDHLASRLSAFHIPGIRRVEVDEARADVSALRGRDDNLGRLLVNTCYGALSPYEVAIGRQKVVGLAQVRRREAALFVLGILLDDQSPLADFLLVPDEPTREQLRSELRRRTIGLRSLTDRSASEVAAAIAGARPSAP